MTDSRLIALVYHTTTGTARFMLAAGFHTLINCATDRSKLFSFVEYPIGRSDSGTVIDND